jgi:hypothetical protein
MEIDWLKYERKNHVMSWLILEAMAEIGIDKFGKFDASKLDVELKINEIEVPIIGAMEHLQGKLSYLKDQGRKEGMIEAEQIMRDNIQRVFEGLNDEE